MKKDGIVFSTLIELLKFRATNNLNETAFTFLVDGEEEEIFLNYERLESLARSLAKQILEQTAPGERALLLFPPGLEYISAFLGCLYAGVIAVPTYPPHPRSLERLLSVVNNAQPTLVITVPGLSTSIRQWLIDYPHLKVLTWSHEGYSSVEIDSNWIEPKISEDSVAFLQYTSGSTGVPKGVVVTHSNLIHNLEHIRQLFGHNPKSRGVIWLPPYHDMGLVGGLLQPLYVGFPVVLMSPTAFVQHPIRWLQAISRTKATTSGGPDFAYNLCIEKISPTEKLTLDLSSWEVAFNGAEPIRHETLERFVKAFQASGFRREAFYPCYGLAEGTLLVSGNLKTRLPLVHSFSSLELEHGKVKLESGEDGKLCRILVSCGAQLPDHRIEIVNPDTLIRCLPDQVGEIWLAGPSVSRGYWNQIEETTKTFRGYLNGNNSEPFLRTGDLGFVYKGELFITGRLKDLLIFRGLNYSPEDIENTINQCHLSLQNMSGAAFSITKGNDERLIVVQEIQRDYKKEDVESILDSIIQSVAESHGIEVDTVVLIKQGSLSKTPSGKTQRQLTRKKFIDGSLKVIVSRITTLISKSLNPFLPYSNQPNQKISLGWDYSVEEKFITERVLMCIADMFGLNTELLDHQKPLTAYGLDSIKALELAHAIEKNLNVIVPLGTLLDGLNIHQLIQQILGYPTTNDHSASGIIRSSWSPQKGISLSYGQRAIWFLNQLEPENKAYHLACAFRISSQINISVLQQCFQDLLDRHAILRTTYHNQGGEPVQVIHKDIIAQIKEQNVIGCDSAEIDKLLMLEIHRPFDLENGPIVHMHIYSQSPSEHILLLTLHHIAADFWSIALLLHELGFLYSARINGLSTTLPDSQMQYFDYIHWQTELLGGSEGEHLWKYWQRKLSGELPVLELPTNRHRPNIQTFNGASFRFEIDTEMAQKLKNLAASENTTLYTVLVSVFNVLLYKYSGQSDILIGSPMAGRKHSSHADIVGYLANPVVLRTKIDGKLSFSNFLKRTKQTVIDAIDHQHFPFPLLVDRLNPLRDLSRSPIFQVLFVLQKAQIRGMDDLAALILGESGIHANLGGLQLESIMLTEQAVQFDITLMMAETDQGIIGSFKYNSDLFDQDMITRMSDHLRHLLYAVIENPETQIDLLTMIGELELRTILVDRNCLSNSISNYPLVYNAIEMQAELRPEKVALICGNEEITFRDLNIQSNQLARYLQMIGVGPEVIVGICFERSIAMAIGIIGIMKAGGAYAPIDPGYPDKRIDFMLQDTQMPILLTQKSLESRFSHYGVRIISVETDQIEISKQSTSNLQNSCQPDNLAYVIYTSGSTGIPKGAMITHSNLGPYIQELSKVLEIQDFDVQILISSFAFAASIRELLIPLSLGASVIIARAEQIIDPIVMFEVIRDYGVTLFSVTPSYWRSCILSLTELEESRRIALLNNNLRLVMSASESLWPDLPTDWSGKLNQTSQVLNLFGQTELTGIVTIHKVIKHIVPTFGDVPAGFPIPGVQAYILDKNLHPVPVGLTGKLYFGGAFIARGYLNQAEMTAEKFIPNPFGDLLGSRLYDTGDLARYLPTGEIEYMGRVDTQVKIRGFRIEPDEIESHLRKCPGVEDAAIIDYFTERGDRYLVGYFVPERNTSSPPKDVALREHLNKYVPDYMIPSFFEQIDSLPLNVNGKLDRHALRKQGHRVFHIEDRESAETNTELETALVKIWRQVLNIERIGVNDSFFEVGGTSLSIVRVRDAISSSFKKEIPVVKLFQYPTIRSLAEYLNGYTVPRSIDDTQEVASRRKKKIKSLDQKKQRKQNS